MVSVLLANYNNGQYLDTCIASVINQSYKDIEIIIVDDCSTDSSEEVLGKYRDATFTIGIYYNEQNLGCGYSKKRAIDLSAGEYLLFLDPDDTLATTAIEDLLAIHLNNKDCAIAYGTHFICDSQLNVLSVSQYPGAIARGEPQMTPNGKKISAPALFRRDIYLKTPGIDPHLKRAIDQDLYSKLEEHGYPLFLDKPLYFYRQHPQSLSLFSNNIKAQFWNMLIAVATYERRKLNPSKYVRNLTTSELRCIRFYYYQRLAHKALHERRFNSFIPLFLKLLTLTEKQTALNLLGLFKLSVSRFFNN